MSWSLICASQVICLQEYEGTQSLSKESYWSMSARSYCPRAKRQYCLQEYKKDTHSSANHLWAKPKQLDKTVNEMDLDVCELWDGQFWLCTLVQTQVE